MEQVPSSGLARDIDFTLRSQERGASGLRVATWRGLLEQGCFIVERHLQTDKGPTIETTNTWQRRADSPLCDQFVHPTASRTAAEPSSVLRLVALCVPPARLALPLFH